ncbi:MAG: peptide chain release factor N(5)-glutamine methyltransferase [Syntrophorhabdaceae bacterium]|nr:peptide chain release factor N(5)-glutamine methyltransferase [Syntrophorhabdaceae bacterium]
MTVSKLLSEAQDLPINERISIVSFALSIKKEDIFIRQDETLTDDKVELVRSLFEERKKGKPLAYIIRHKEFFSEDFFVNESVLIPRPETEILVEQAIDIIKNMKSDTKVLDVGTGSGVIGIIIAKHTGRDVFCLDVSMGALKVASINSERLGVKHRITFICADLLSALKEKELFHVIVANLPYIRRDEWKDLMKDVRDFEPEVALLGGSDGLELYRRLINSLKGVMVKNGWFLCEIGGAEQAMMISKLLKEEGFNTSIIKDYSGIERIVKSQWISS